VLDQARDFESAVSLLEDYPLLSPVLLMVTGIKNSQRVVIERTPDESIVRRARGPLLLTNHYVTREMRDGNIDLSDWDTEDRMDAIRRRTQRRPVDSAAEALAALTCGALVGSTTQQQIVMLPQTGELVVRIPGSKAESYSA
jgi:hypothetical protein